jgi:hypothetical protein
VNWNKGRVIWVVVFGIAFVANFAAIRYCEYLNRCDSVGVWYSAYGATINATLITIALGGLVFVLKAIQRKVKADA